MQKDLTDLFFRHVQPCVYRLISVISKIFSRPTKSFIERHYKTVYVNNSLCLGVNEDGPLSSLRISLIFDDKPILSGLDQSNCVPAPLVVH